MQASKAFKSRAAESNRCSGAFASSLSTISWQHAGMSSLDSVSGVWALWAIA